MSKRRIAVIVAACFFCELTAVGVGAGTNSLYTAPICEDLGISRTVYSVSTSLMYLVNMIAYFSFPFLLCRIPIRGIFAIGFVAEAMAFILYSFSKDVMMLYSASSLLGAGLVFLGAVPITAVISSWFPNRQGTMLGVVFAGSGIGGALLIPAVGSLMQYFNWRIAFLFSAALVGVSAIFCVTFVQKNNQKETTNAALQKGSLGSFLQMRGAKALLVYGFLVGFSIQPTYLSIAAHLSADGITTQKASQVLGIICLVSLVIKVVLGAISDRFGPISVLLISHGAFFLVEILLVFFTKELFLIELCFGIGCTPLSLVLPIVARWLFQEKSGQALSLSMATQTAGIALGILLTGWMFDTFGGYEESFLMLAVVNVVGLVCLGWGCGPRLWKKRVISET